MGVKDTKEVQKENEQKESNPNEEGDDKKRENTNCEKETSPRRSSEPESDTEDERDEEVNMSKLKSLIPQINIKDNVTQLDVILEAIRYIDSLKEKLCDKILNAENGKS